MRVYAVVSVAGEAGDVRLERPIDSSSDKLSVHRK